LVCNFYLKPYFPKLAMKVTIKLLLAAILLLASFPSFSQVINDNCSGAIGLTVSTAGACDNAVFGTTLYAVPSGIGACNAQATDVWYSFVATAAVQDVRVINVLEAYYHYYSETYRLEIFSGGCGQLQHLFCFSTLNGIRANNLIPGDTYYLRLTNDNGIPIEYQICVSVPDQLPPVNDDCIGAKVLAVEPGAICNTPLYGSTENASASILPACTDCLAHEDVWYKFIATQSTHVVSLTDVRRIIQGDYYNINVETYTNSCNNLVSLQRNALLYREDSLVFTSLNPGQTYYLRLYNDEFFQNDPVGFNICVKAPKPPANDDCLSATVIISPTVLDCGGQVTGSFYGATSSGANCQAGAVNDVWYQFTAGSPSHRVAMAAANNSSYGFEVYSGDCNQLVSITCADGDYPARTLTGLTVGQTYYVRAFSSSYSAFDFQICILTLPPPPPNDECTGAISLPVNPGIGYDLYTSGSTLGATSSMTSCGGTENTHDVWYSFAAISVSHRLLLYDNGEIFGDGVQLGYEVFKGNCNQLNRLACGHVAPDYAYETLLGGLTPGDTYFVRVYSLAGSNHNFSLTIQTLPAPPANTDCVHAESITSTVEPDCGSSVSGNTAGVLSLETGNCFSGKSLWYSFTAVFPTEMVHISNVQEGCDPAVM
jgi:hypothetical protein